MLLLVLAKLARMKAKDRVLVWRRVNEFGATPIIRSAFTLPDDKEGQMRANALVRLIEEKGGEAWFFFVEPHSDRDTRRVNELVKNRMDSEVREFLEECDEFLKDLSKELQEKEFEFYELEELGDDLHKLERWKNKLAQKYPSNGDIYDRLNSKLEECRVLMKTFEKGVLKKART